MPALRFALLPFALALPLALAAPPDPARARAPLAQIAAPPAAAASAPVAELNTVQRDRLQQAQQHFDRGQWLAAVMALTELRAELEPGLADVEWLLAQAQMRLGAPDEALAAAQRATALDPRHADANVLAALLLLARDDAAEALPHLRAATLAGEQDINNVAVTHAWWLLARTLRDEGYVAAAAEAFARFDSAVWQTHTEHQNAPEIGAILSANPRGAFEERLALLAALDDRRAALQLSEQGLRQWPQDPAVQRAHAEALIASGDPRAAFEFAEERLQDAAGRAAFLDVALRAAAAADVLPDWIKRLGDPPLEGERLELAAAVALALEAQGRLAPAAELGQDVLRAAPRRTGIALLVADWHMTQDDVAAALKLLIEHVRSQGAQATWSKADVHRAVSLLSLRPGIEQHISAIAPADGADFAIDFVYGLRLQAAGDAAAAQQRFAAAAQANPDFTPAHVAAAELLLARYDWLAAKAYAEDLLQRQPKLAVAHYILAQACAGLDEHDAAEAAFRHAVQHAEREPSYALALAQFYRWRPDALSSAQRYFRQALALDAQSDEAFEGLIECYLLENKLELARTEFDRLRGSGVSPDALRRVETALRFHETQFDPPHLEELARQAREHPADARTLQTYGIGLFQNGQFSRATEVIQQAAALRPDDYELALQAAQMLRWRAMLTESIVALEHLRARYPNRRRVLELLAINLVGDFRQEEGRALLRKLMQSGPEQAEAYRGYLLGSYTGHREFEPALALLDQWIKEQPDDRALQWSKVQTLALAERFDEAHAYVLERQRESPDDPLWHEVLRRTAQWAEQYDEAIAVARKAAENEQRGADATGELIELLLLAGRHEEALAISKNYEGSFGDQILRRIWMGRCHGAAGDVALCVAEFEALLAERLVPAEHKPTIKDEMIKALRDAKAYDEALKRIDEWLAAEPNNRQRLLGWKLEVLLEADAPQERQIAVMEELYEFQRKLPVDQKSPALHNDLGYSWADMNVRLDEAEDMVRFAVGSETYNPLNAAYVDSLGWVLYKRGDFAEARRHLERAAKLAGDRDGVICDHLGDAAWRLGDREAAAENWRRSIATLENAEEPRERDAALLEEIRGKLSAVEAGGEPQVARTAAERSAE